MESGKISKPFPEGPLDFTTCPNCGSERRVAEEVLKAEQKEGRCVGLNRAWLHAFTSQIAPPGGGFLSCKVIFTFLDACADCGTIYVVHSESKTAMQGMNPTKLGPPPNFVGD